MAADKAAEDVGEPSQRIQAVAFASLDEWREDRPGFATTVEAR